MQVPLIDGGAEVKSYQLYRDVGNPQFFSVANDDDDDDDEEEEEEEEDDDDDDDADVFFCHSAVYYLFPNSWPLIAYKAGDASGIYTLTYATCLQLCQSWHPPKKIDQPNFKVLLFCQATWKTLSIYVCKVFSWGSNDIGEILVDVVCPVSPEGWNAEKCHHQFVV